MPSILIADALSPRAVEIFEERGLEVTVKTGLKPPELVDIIGNFDGLAVRSATKVTAEILAAAERLKVIGRAGTGVDTIDVAAATKRGIVVMNTPFGNSTTTAEHAIAMMFALARQLPAADRSTQDGKWEKSRFMGVELAGKTLGIIGCGNIGSIVADRARGLKMRVIGYDPFLSIDRARELGIEKLELDALYARADFITIHTPMTDDTRHLLGAAAIAKMKRGVRLINCARGGLIVEADLKAALDSGHVAGAALDVFEIEPAKDNPLFGTPGLIATPHLGASTNEAQENVAVEIAAQMAAYLVDGTVSNAVNLPNISAEEAPSLRPYLALGEALGSLLGQLAQSGLTRVQIEYQGEVAGLNTRPISAAMLTGLLQPGMPNVNRVNVAGIARERNIQVSETRHDFAGDYHTKIRLLIATDHEQHEVGGTLILGHLPRIIEIDGIQLEAELHADMLFVRNLDRPGFIGSIGRVLGEAGINIANFHLGRAAPGKDAILLAAIDEALPQSVLEEIKQLPLVIAARMLNFARIG